MGPVTRIGVDVGQRIDPTAIVVVEESERDVEPAGDQELGEDGRRKIESVFTARHVERLSLGVSYPHVAERVAEIARGVAERSSKPWVVVDVTGVGRPVFELIRDALEGTRVRLSAATFTTTDRLEGGYRSSELRVGKAWMVSRLQALLQTRRIRLPDTREARALADELLDFELRVTDSATVQAGAFRTGKHDDLVIAVGLGTLEAGSSAARISAAGFASANAGLRQQSPFDDGGPDRWAGWGDE